MTTEKCILCNTPIINKGFCDKHSTNKMLNLPINKSNNKVANEETKAETKKKVEDKKSSPNQEINGCADFSTDCVDGGKNGSK